MKHVKSLLALVLTLMLICGMAVVPAAAAEGQLVGDAKLFLPSTGPIKVQYTLTTDGTTTVDGATYAITKVENADNSEIAADDIWKYAQIDATTGALYVSQAAKGKEIFLSATSADYTGSKSVVVSDVSYGTNFDTMPSFITTSVAVAKDSDENSFAPFYGGKWGNAFTNYIDLTGVNFATSHLTMEAKFKSTGAGNNNATSTVPASYYNPTYPFQIVYDKSFVGCGAWNSAGDKTQIVTAEWSTATTSTAQTSQMNFTQYSYNENATTNNGYYRASNSKTGTYTYTGSYTTDANAATNGTFSDDFEFIDFKAEIIDDKAYTTLGGTKTEHNFVNHISDVSVADANIKTINFGAPIDDLEIYTGERASATLFDAAKVVGDSKLFLPSSGTIKVQYGMETNAGEAITEGVTYSVIGEDVASYALMDAATGELLIDAKALNKTFTVKAATADAEATMAVTTNSFSYSADFEDGTMPSFISNANSVGFATANGNKYAKFKGGDWGVAGSSKIDLSAANFAPQVLTVDAKFLSAGVGDTSGTSYKNPMVPFQINYDKTFVGFADYKGTANKEWPVSAWLRASAGADKQVNVLVPLYKSGTVNGVTGQWVHGAHEWVSVGSYAYEGTYTKADNAGNYSFSDDFSLTNVKYVVKNNQVHVSINGQTSVSEKFISQVKDIETGEQISTTGLALKDITFGGPIAEIEVYSGEKTSGAYAISGESTIVPAGNGTKTTYFTYTATPELPWADENAAISWGLKADYAGVSVEAATGKLTVAGTAARGTVTLQAKDASGAVVGEKAIKITGATDTDGSYSGDYYTYVNRKNVRFSQDFEAYTVGSGISSRVLGPNAGWNDYLLQPYSYVVTKFDDSAAKIKVEANGNKYSSSYGRLWWSQDGAGLKFGISDSIFNNSTSVGGNYFKNAPVANLEGRFMIESETVAAMSKDDAFSIISYDASGLASTETYTGLDMRYKKLTNNLIGIYHAMVGGFGDRDLTLLAVVPVDTWFGLRLEHTPTTKTYDIYVNERLVADDVATGMETIATGWSVGCAVDDLFAYNGKTTAAEVTGTEFKVGNTAQNVGFATDYAMTEGANVVSVTLGEAAPAGVSDNAKLIIAQYSGDKMVKMTSVPVTVVNGKLYGCAALTAEYAAGDTVKAFLWNWGTLQPVK